MWIIKTVGTDSLDKKKACCIIEDNLTLWSYSRVLVAFHCWKRLQSSVINLSSVIITLMLIPPPHTLLLQHLHVRGFRDQHSGCWIRLVSGQAHTSLCSFQGVGIRKTPAVSEPTWDRVPRLRFSNNSNQCYQPSFAPAPPTLSYRPPSTFLFPLSPVIVAAEKCH